MEKARQEIGDLAQTEEDIISYALFPQVARSFLERRARGSGGAEAIVAAISALVTQRNDRRFKTSREEFVALTKSRWRTRTHA